MITIYGILQTISMVLVIVFVIGLIVPKTFYPKSKTPRLQVTKFWGLTFIGVFFVTLLWSGIRGQFFPDQVVEYGGVVVLRYEEPSEDEGYHSNEQEERYDSEVDNAREDRFDEE